MAYNTPPPAVPDVLVSFPVPHVLLITLNRPKKLNALHFAQHAALSGLYDWYDAEPDLRCAVVTGAGRAFCVGADLQEWLGQMTTDVKTKEHPSQPNPPQTTRTTNFGGLSNRLGKKPVIAAVNGPCLGGGMEMVVNADMVIACETAAFGLPEAKRGVVAVAGSLPRLQRSVGKQRAAEIAMLGRTYDAGTLREWGLVNVVVAEGQDVVEEAVRIAVEVASNSPDSVIVTRDSLQHGWGGMRPDLAAEVIINGIYRVLGDGENIKEGMRSFNEKRQPKWANSKL